MKHLKKGRKFSREKGQREAMLKIMLGNFLLKEKMRTTEAKSKELKTLVEKFISKTKNILVDGKIANLPQLRILMSKLPRNISTEILKKIAEKFQGRTGGYVRIIKLGRRNSDGAKMAVIEMIND
jgi:large subunit ribosomal protein L17